MNCGGGSVEGHFTDTAVGHRMLEGRQVPISPQWLGPSPGVWHDQRVGVWSMEMMGHRLMTEGPVGNCE